MQIVRSTNQSSCPVSGEIYVISMEFLAVNRRRLSSCFARSSRSEQEAAVFAGYFAFGFLLNTRLILHTAF